MPQTVTITSEAYRFDELSDEAKERARNWYREIDTDRDFELELEDFETICEILGVELDRHEVRLMSGKTRTAPNIYYSVGYCQSDFASFEGTYDYMATAPAKIREHAPQDEKLHAIADQLTVEQIRWGFGLQARITDASRGSYASVEVHDRRNEDRDVNEAEQSIKELIRDLERWLYDYLRAEVDYRSSDECVDESIEANEYMFDEEGDRHAYA